MNNYKDIIFKVIKALYPKMKDKIIVINDSSIRPKSMPENLKLLNSPNNPIPYESINNFYRNFGSCSIEWRVTKEHWEKIEDEMNEYLGGCINIRPFDRLIKFPYLEDGEDDMGYDNIEIDEEKVKIPQKLAFYDIDMLTDGNAIGFFVGEDYDDRLWHRSNVGEFFCLGVTIDGYIELLSHTYGVYYWQDYLLSSDDTLEQLVKQINPDFDMKTFDALHTRLLKK